MNRERRFVFTVKQLTQYVKALLGQDRALQDVWVRGEVGDLVRHGSGHVYFTLKDEYSQLRCVLFREEASYVSFDLAAGMQVAARGAVTVYEPRGQYQLVVRELEEAGLGDLYLAFERLRRKLAAEGLFDADRKRPLPAFPRTIALLTSPDGAAVHDVLTTLRRRWPGADIILVPTPVSGPAAVPGIVRSLERLAALDGVDVAILARGGGSLEELSAFNAEEVARAMARSPVPLVTGIGHEVDVTIADLVADLRAATPTAAAAAVSPELRDVLARIDTARRSVARSLARSVARYRRELGLLLARPLLRDPRLLLADRRQRVDELASALQRALAKRIEDARSRLAAVSERLRALNPRAVLRRGYSITRLPDGRIVTTVRQLSVGGSAEIVLNDGSAGVAVQEVRGQTE
jgi:exodeoxyribonuclease VII large subunit